MSIAAKSEAKASEMEMVAAETEQVPPAPFSGRGFERTVLSLLLVCAVGVTVDNLDNLPPAFRFGTTPVSTPKTPGGQFIAAIPARAIARPFDGSRLLKTGETVVVGGRTAPSVQKVAAGPNQTVLLRNGTSLKALYLVGRDSYVVTSDQRASIVRPDDIRATIPTPF